MTIARQNTAASLAISIQDSESVDIRSLWKLVRLGARFSWHTKAYGTILGIMLLTLVSLIFLSMHWSYRRLFPFFSHRVIESNWDQQLKVRNVRVASRRE